MGRHFVACSIAVLLVGLADGARADVLSPPPERCPEGSAGRDCHGPPLCAALICEIDSDCADGSRCVERPLCARSETCAGGWGGSGTPNTHVDGPCGSGGTCDGWGTSCQNLKVCVAIGNLDAGTPRPDAGGSPTDAGGTTTDAGGTSIDAGAGATDAGRDGGGRTDSGPSRQDAGGGGTTSGGCCSAVGARSGAGGALFVALILATALRRSRRR
jgi:hypothetical protein